MTGQRCAQSRQCPDVSSFPLPIPEHMTGLLSTSAVRFCLRPLENEGKAATELHWPEQLHLSVARRLDQLLGTMPHGPNGSSESSFHDQFQCCSRDRGFGQVQASGCHFITFLDVKYGQRQE